MEAEGKGNVCADNHKIDSIQTCQKASDTLYPHLNLNVIGSTWSYLPSGCSLRAKCNPKSGSKCAIYFKVNTKGENNGNFKPICVDKETIGPEGKPKKISRW